MEVVRENGRKYVRNNKAKVLARTRKYQASKQNATPKWLSKQQLLDIEKMYIIANSMQMTTGLHYEVDHIIPLNGKNVRGLHVPWNLQIILRADNRRKHNKCLM